MRLRLIIVAALGAGIVAAPALAQETTLDLSQVPLVATTKLHRPADPLNVALVGTKDQVIALMQAAGWQPADPVTWRSGAGIVRSVAFRRAYPTAPVSSLYYQGHKQDMAFEKQVGRSASKRHHVRFWKLRDEANGSSLWLGDATFDRSVGLSHHGAVTHHIDGDVDQERAFLMGELAATQRVTVTTVKGQGERRARNGGGDPYWTDGDVMLGVIKAP